MNLFFRPHDTKLITKEGSNTLPVSVNYSNFQGDSTQFSVKSNEVELRAVIPGKYNKNEEFKFIRIPPEKLIIERKNDE